MFDFYVACVRKFSLKNNCYYWRPIKIYTSRSSCIRFFRSYGTKPFELNDFGIIHLNQDFVNELTFKEVFYGKN